MTLTVNGTTIPADAIAREMTLHADAPDPRPRRGARSRSASCCCSAPASSACSRTACRASG